MTKCNLTLLLVVALTSRHAVSTEINLKLSPVNFVYCWGDVEHDILEQATTLALRSGSEAFRDIDYDGDPNRRCVSLAEESSVTLRYAQPVYSIRECICNRSQTSHCKIQGFCYGVGPGANSPPYIIDRYDNWGAACCDEAACLDRAKHYFRSCANALIPSGNGNVSAFWQPLASAASYGLRDEMLFARDSLSAFESAWSTILVPFVSHSDLRILDVGTDEGEAAQFFLRLLPLATLFGIDDYSGHSRIATGTRALVHETAPPMPPPPPPWEVSPAQRIVAALRVQTVPGAQLVLIGCGGPRRADRGVGDDGCYSVLDHGLGDVRTVLSFGVGGSVDFELDLLPRLHPAARIHLFDPFAAPPRAHPRMHYRPLGCGGADGGDMRTLQTLVSQVEEPGKAGGRRLLKMDVEGAEWATLAAASDSLLASFDQIILEAHGLLHDEPPVADPRADGAAWERGALGSGRADVAKAEVLERLAARHALVHARRPPVVGASFLPWTGLLAGEVVSELLELTYVRRDALPSDAILTPADPPRAAARWRHNVRAAARSRGCAVTEQQQIAGDGRRAADGGCCGAEIALADAPLTAGGVRSVLLELAQYQDQKHLLGFNVIRVAAARLESGLEDTLDECLAHLALGGKMIIEGYLGYDSLQYYNHPLLVSLRRRKVVHSQALEGSMFDGVGQTGESCDFEDQIECCWKRTSVSDTVDAWALARGVLIEHSDANTREACCCKDGRAWLAVVSKKHV